MFYYKLCDDGPLPLRSNKFKRLHCLIEYDITTDMTADMTADIIG